MSHLALFLLGSPHIECDGIPIDVDTRKAIALIAYLAVTQQSHTRDTLAALAETALTLCASQGDRHREAALHNNLADLLHSLGRSEEAMSHLKQAVSIYAEIGVEAGTVQPEIWKLVEW